MVRIVSVDDDRVFQSMLVEMLGLEGWTVSTINDERTAFGELREDPPDLVMLDVRMGSTESGWTLLEQLRADPATRDIPVIVCSGASLRAREEHLTELGVTILPKPFDIDSLYHHVRAALANGEYSSAQ